MQPQALEIADLNIQGCTVRQNLFGHHRTNFFEDFAALLAKQLVASTNARLITTIQEAEIVADGVGELRLQARAEGLLTELSPDLPLANRRLGRSGKDGL